MDEKEIPNMEIYLFPNQVVDLVKTGSVEWQGTHFKIKLTTSVNDFGIERFSFLLVD